jgi:site-2 protease. Metallo peptidase. MEROPS family M50B
MDWLTNIAGFLLVIGVLVTVHEFGHFWVARRVGVKVLRFSVGFGRPLFKRTGADGTEYVLAAIPLGGYVKMLDEREGPVEPAQLEGAFNRKPLWARNAIIVAGPAFNFMLAILAYWAVLLSGRSKSSPSSVRLPRKRQPPRQGLPRVTNSNALAGPR